MELISKVNGAELSGQNPLGNEPPEQKSTDPSHSIYSNTHSNDK